MAEQFHAHRYHVNWNLRFICDCRKKHPELKIYPATAKQLSPFGTCIQSTHNVCSNRSITLRLDVPPATNGESTRTVEIIGRTIFTVLEGNYFLTEIEFLRFDKRSQQILALALAQHFGGLAG